MSHFELYKFLPTAPRVLSFSFLLISFQYPTYKSSFKLTPLLVNYTFNLVVRYLLHLSVYESCYTFSAFLICFTSSASRNLVTRHVALLITFPNPRVSKMEVGLIKEPVSLNSLIIEIFYWISLIFPTCSTNCRLYTKSGRNSPYFPLIICTSWPLRACGKAKSGATIIFGHAWW
jgi:hypothetical protein